MAAEQLLLTIVAPERKLLDRHPVEEVTLPSSEGEIQVLPGHAAMIGTLFTGVFSYKSSGNDVMSGAISTGFFEVRENQLTLLPETIELSGEIDVGRAQEAQKKAEDVLKEADLDESTFRKYQLKLQRALVRQKAAENK